MSSGLGQDTPGALLQRVEREPWHLPEGPENAAAGIGQAHRLGKRVYVRFRPERSITWDSPQE